MHLVDVLLGANAERNAPPALARRVLSLLRRAHRPRESFRAVAEPNCDAYRFADGAERVIGIDRSDYRLAMARTRCGAETVNYEQVDSVTETLIEMTASRGPMRASTRWASRRTGTASTAYTTASRAWKRIDPLRCGRRSWRPTHRMPLSEAPKGYDILLNKEDNCERVVLKA